MLERSLDIVDSRVRHPAAFQMIQPLFGRSRASDAFDKLLQLYTVFYTIGVSDELGVCLPLRFAEFVAENAVQPVITAAEENVAVACLERLVRHDGWVSGAPSSGVWLAADET